jgi:hypothetical protein
MNISSKIIVTGVTIAIIGLAIWGWLALAGSPSQAAKSDWGGVDDQVIEKIAAEAGREAQAPLINTDQGDLLLFFFAISGAVGGFVAGYFWRKLISEKGNRPPA